MLNSIEKIRKEGQALLKATTKQICREGSKVKGHWRNYKDHSVWIDEHDRDAYQVRVAK